MKNKIIKVIGTKIIKIDGINIKVELRMLDYFGKTVFRPYARWGAFKRNLSNCDKSVNELLRKKYCGELKKVEIKNER